MVKYHMRMLLIREKINEKGIDFPYAVKSEFGKGRVKVHVELYIS